MRRLALLALAALASAFASAAPALAATSWIAQNGSGNGEFSDPSSIALDSAGRLIVADSGNSRIQVLDREGNFIRSVGSYGTAPGQFDSVYGFKVAVGADDEIYAIQGSGGHVQRFSRDGAFLGRWGGEDGPEAERFANATALTTDAAGNVYVAASPSLTTEQHILKYTRAGALLSSFPVKNAAGTARSARDLAVVGGDVVALLENMHGNSIARYGPDGAIKTEFANRTTDYESAAHIMHPTGLSTGAAGIYIAHGSGVGLFTLDGDFVSGYASRPSLRGDGGWDSCDPAKNGFYPQFDPSAGSDFTDVAVYDGEAYMPALGGVFKIDSAPLPVLQALPDSSWAPMGLEDFITGLQTGQVATFYAGRSSLSFGSIVRHEWDLDGDGTYERDTGTVPTAAIAYPTVGSFTARVRITGSHGTSAEEDLPVVVTDSRALVYPAEMKGRFGVSLTGAQVEWRGHASEIACSRIAKFEWDLDGDGIYETDTGTTDVANATYDEVRKLTVGLRVTRPGGRVDVASMKHEVRPAPPPGRVGMSVNDAAQYTNDKNVTLDLVWPALATHVVVSNDGGFKEETTLPLGEPVRWQLRSSGPERLPKTVYIRFVVITDRGGAGIEDPDRSYSDDIILDETRPVVAAAVAARSRLRLRASDNLSGVADMQVARKKRKPGEWLRFKKRRKLDGAAKKRFVRVRDSAGNASRWRAVKRR